MRNGWCFVVATAMGAALGVSAIAQTPPERILGRVQAVNTEQIVLVTENGTTFIKMTPQASVSLVKAGEAAAPQKPDAAAGTPGKLSDVELGSAASVSVTRTSDGTPVASRIVVETGG
jgi:hypothetical protein